MKWLETERLILRDFNETDVDDLYEYAVLETVGPNAGWRPHQSKEESLQIINHFIESDDVWAIELKKEHKVIGSVGLHKKMDVHGTIMYELGYVLSTLYEKHGYMTEACQKVLDYAFLEENLPLVKVAHFIGNTKSQAVIERLRFVYEKEMIYSSRDYGLKQSKMYQLTKEQYKKNKE